MLQGIWKDLKDLLDSQRARRSEGLQRFCLSWFIQGAFFILQVFDKTPIKSQKGFVPLVRKLFLVLTRAKKAFFKTSVEATMIIARTRKAQGVNKPGNPWRSP